MQATPGEWSKKYGITKKVEPAVLAVWRRMRKESDFVESNRERVSGIG